MRKEYSFATYYRVLGMIFILLCHFTQESINPYLNMSAQFFNIGVDMFIILSGFLFGTRIGQMGNTIQWLKRRFKRIYVPYELFIATLFVIHLFYDKNVLKLDWLWLSLGLQGSVVGILGAEQTWFITSILLCYLATPILDKCSAGSNHRRNVIKGILMIAPAMLALIPQAYVSVVLSPICWYGVAFLAGSEFEGIRIHTRGFFRAFLIMCGSFCVRLVARMLIDGTILYDRIVTSYTQVIAAFAMFYIVAYLTQEKPMGLIMRFVSSISFEVYLYHYMFCVGPVRLFSLTENWLVECCLVTIISIVISCSMKKVSDRVAKRILV